jgi:methylmalonyl-CoA/ethylmalonyl-CoA epimerase
MKFDHIGIVVTTPEAGRATLAGAFGIERWTAEFVDPVNDVIVQFGLDASGICYETVAPLSPDSPVRRALREGVNIVNHTAYLVDGLAVHAQRLRASGFFPVSAPKPAIAYGGRPIQFFISRQKLLFELIEAPDHQHQYFG